MKSRTTAYMLIFWLLCQQVVVTAALASAESLQLGNHSELVLAVLKEHESSKHDHSETHSPNAHNHEHSHSTSDTDCCKVECQCCAGGCLSLFSPPQDFTIPFLSPNLHGFELIHNPQQRFYSLFRPPITS